VGGNEITYARIDTDRAATGLTLVLAILGLIAIIVGVQGLFTPDG
jgi:hypothetical protein